jgi:hypothetical protein
VQPVPVDGAKTWAQARADIADDGVVGTVTPSRNTSRGGHAEDAERVDGSDIDARRDGGHEEGGDAGDGEAVDRRRAVAGAACLLGRVDPQHPHCGEVVVVFELHDPADAPPRSDRLWPSPPGLTSGPADRHAMIGAAVADRGDGWERARSPASAAPC